MRPPASWTWREGTLAPRTRCAVSLFAGQRFNDCLAGLGILEGFDSRSKLRASLRREHFHDRLDAIDRASRVGDDLDVGGRPRLGLLDADHLIGLDLPDGDQIVLVAFVLTDFLRERDL